MSRRRGELELLGQPAAEFDDAVVKEGKATLDRMGHGHTVTLRGEQVRAKEGGDFQVLGALQDAPSVEAIGQWNRIEQRLGLLAGSARTSSAEKKRWMRRVLRQRIA